MGLNALQVLRAPAVLGSYLSRCTVSCVFALIVTWQRALRSVVSSSSATSPQRYICMHSVSLARASCIGFLSEALRIFGTNHTQPNFLRLLLLLYCFFSSSFSFLLLDTVIVRRNLHAAKILPLFHYFLQCVSTHTWGKLLCENDPSHPCCCQKCEGFAVLGDLTATVL